MAKEAIAPEEVTMSDGSVVTFTGKRKMLKTCFVDDNGLVSIRLDFRNGHQVIFEAPESLTGKLIAHGLEQKIGDEIAGVDEVDDCILAVEALCDRLAKGEWGQVRESGGMSGTSVLIRALVECFGKPVETIKTFLASKTHAEKLALRNNVKVKPVVDRLEAEKNAKKAAKGETVDTDAMLGELAQ